MKTMIKTLLLIGLVLASSLSHAQLFGKKDPPKPVSLVATTDKAQALTELITTGQALQHVPKIYSGSNKEVGIASLVLEFVTDTAGSSTRGNIMDDRKTTKQVNYKLLGLTPQVMQSVADEFYDHVKQAIIAQGYTVVDQEKLMANPAFAELVGEVSGGPKASGGGLFSTEGFARAVSKGTADLSQTGVSAAFRNAKLYQSFKDGPLLLSANIIVNFAQFKDVGSFMAGANSQFAAVESGVQLSVAKDSEFNYSNDKGSNAFYMVKTTILPSQIAASVNKVSMTGGQMASLAFGLLAGKAVVNENYEVKAMDNYKELASGDLKMFAEVMAQGLKKQ